ncbi:MAG: hypothetical protein M3281_01815, partial [Chloroflexota bacterium]|nr:hypothetical protein [Chloroflexota bacterium]
MTEPHAARRMLFIAALLIGAESALLYLLLAELSGSPTDTPLPWPWLWIVGLGAFLLGRQLEGGSKVRLLVVLAGPALAATTVSLLGVRYLGHRPWSPGWVTLATLALLGLCAWQALKAAPTLDAAAGLLKAGPVPV